MIIGLDYFKTLTVHHKTLRPLASLIKAEGGMVYIISALSDMANRDQYEKALEKFLKDTNFPYTNFHVVVFHKGKEAEEIPMLKLEKAQELGVQLYIDDRADVAELMAQFGIMGLQVKNWFPKTGLDNGDDS